MGQGFGDRLAKGGTKAAFPASSAQATQDAWDVAFGDFDAKKYNEDEDAKQAERERLRDTDLASNGDAGAVSGEAESNS